MSVTLSATTPAAARSYPPGFRGSPFALRTRAAGNDPLAFLQALAATPNRGLVPFTLAGRAACLVTDPAVADEVLARQHVRFIKADALVRARRLLGNGLLTAEGAAHRASRAQVQQGLGRRSLDAYAAPVLTHAGALARAFETATEVDLLDLLGGLTQRIILDVLFGPGIAANAAAVRSVVRSASTTADPLLSLVAPSRHVRRARRALVQLVDGWITESLASGSDGCLLRAMHPAGAPVTDQLRDDVLTMFLAGHETIAGALAWTLLMLARSPEWQARLVEELAAVTGPAELTAGDLPQLRVVRAVLAETLRLHPPSWVLARQACEAVTLGGHALPAGTLVLVSQYVFHRDPRWFAAPTRFDPSRWLAVDPQRPGDVPFLPFGRGPRGCVGESFAWMEGVLILATLLRHCRVATEPDAPLAPDVTITMRPSQARATLVPRRTR